jgi:3-oxoacyl-(acyl-carrier-protein) synthase
MKNAVITGIGPVTPIGIDIDSFWENTVNGVSGTGTLEELPLNFPVDKLKSRIVASVNNDWLDTRKLAEESRFFHLGLLACELAIRDARISEEFDSKTSVVVGSAVGGTAVMEATYLHIKNDPNSERRRYLLRDMSFNSMAIEIAQKYGCRGQVLTVSTGCTAGIDAIGIGLDLIKFGMADTVIVGAVDAPLTPVVFASFDVIGALSVNNDNPTIASRPFDRDRDGFVLGEGAAFIVLEEEKHAKRRNAQIYAEIKGYASVSNSHHMTDLPNDGASLADCLRLTLKETKLDISDIDHINAHGSSTPQNDICETNAIKNVFGKHSEKLTVNSLKAITGHALGASNTIEIIACALALKNQKMFPTAHLDFPGEGCDLDYIANNHRKMPLRNILKLSSGFSGIHSALVMSVPS